MKKKVEELKIEGVTYVPKDSVTKEASLNKDGLPYRMIRTYSAGVFCGYLKEKNGKEGVLLEAIRIWRWSGAASLSQLSQEGTNDPDNCKFGVPIDRLELTEIIEVMSMTEKAKSSIKEKESWRA